MYQEAIQLDFLVAVRGRAGTLSIEISHPEAILLDFRDMIADKGVVLVICMHRGFPAYHRICMHRGSQAQRRGIHWE